MKNPPFAPFGYYSDTKLRVDKIRLTDGTGNVEVYMRIEDITKSIFGSNRGAQLVVEDLAKHFEKLHSVLIIDGCEERSPYKESAQHLREMFKTYS